MAFLITARQRHNHGELFQRGSTNKRRWRGGGAKLDVRGERSHIDPITRSQSPSFFCFCFDRCQPPGIHMQVCSALIVAPGGTDNARIRKNDAGNQKRVGRAATDVGACQSDYWTLIKEQKLIKVQTLRIENKIHRSW